MSQQQAKAQPATRSISGRYRVIDQLGAGGMGVVFRVHDEVLHREVALKQLLAAPIAESKRKLITALFEREYHTLVRLKHPRIIEVYDFGVSDDGPYYTMELLSGQDLQELAPLPPLEVCRHLRDVASSLALLHGQGLIHRDVSPRNVRLTADGRTKLIDFGALAPFGIASVVVGSPVCVAPELLQRMPLDQRADLYALGVLGYVALTGRAPFAARRLEDLPALWEHAPLAPSAWVANVPPELDALLLSLLKIDRLARPSSAAAVIDRLTLIGQLAPDEHEQASRSDVLSAALVGREREQAWLRERAARALLGKGAQVVISGGAGIGKTRLLQELSLEAQLKGLVALRADAQVVPEPFGVAARLGVELAMACPEQARLAAGEHAGLLAQLSEGLRETLGDVPLVALELDPAERRARFQAALYAWFVRMAQQRVLLVAVDNVQAADHNSASFLAALGHASAEHRIVLLVTQRNAEVPVAPEPLRSLRKHAAQLKLGALSAEACEQLVKSLFGNVDNTRRVAKALHERSAGNVRHCMDLAQLLVRKQIARYVGGTWVLPSDVTDDELPNRAEELVAMRLAELSSAARDLVQTLSVDGAPVSLERCAAFLPGLAKGEIHRALGELVAAQILSVESDKYRFSQEALREAVLGQMDDARRRALHLQLASELLAAPPQIGRSVEAAMHLLQAGEETRGADLIANAGRAYVRDGTAYDATPRVVRALLQALEIYERQGRSKYELAGVLYPLVPLGYFVDWRVVRDHGERALHVGLEATGLLRAQQLRRFIGPKLGLTLGLGAAAARFAIQRRLGLDYDLKQALRSVMALLPSAVGTASTCFDGAAVERIAGMIEPLTMLGEEDQIPRLLYRFAITNRFIMQGRERAAAQGMGSLAPCFRQPKIVASVGEGQSKAMYGGVLYCQALMECFQFGQRALEVTREMDSLGVQAWVIAAEQVRLLYHAYRGESENFELCRERVELYAVQGDSTWQTDIFLPAALLIANLLTADTVAARRDVEQLARRAEHLPSLEPFARLAHASYLSLRGDLVGAIAEFERVLPDFEPHSRFGWLSMRGQFADALNRAGQHARAKQLTLDGLSCSPREDYVSVMQHLEPQRQLALAEAGLGNHARATELLDGLLAEHGHQDNRLLVGLLHKARAEVALQLADEPGLRTHLAAMEQRFRSTRNPALIAQVERLTAEALRAKLLPATASLSANQNSDATLLAGSLAGLTSAPDRHRYALQVVVQRARARSGFLYKLHGEQFRLIAASSTNEPPIGLETELRESAKRLRNGVSQQRSNLDADDADMATVFIDSSAPPSAAPSHEKILLTIRQDGRAQVVGGLILEGGQPGLLDVVFLDSLARVLFEYETVSTAF